MKNWNDLPAEIKEMIVKRCTEKTRIALKSTSRSNKQIVKGTRVKSINYLKIIQETDGSFRVSIRHRKVLHLLLRRHFDEYTTYPNARTFQTAITDLLKTVDCIETLKIQTVKYDIPLEEWSDDGSLQRLKVERLIITAARGRDPRNIIEQIEPVYLRTVEIQDDGGSSAIYDMPQIVLAEEVQAGRSILERQLLKLNARCVKVAGALPHVFSLHKIVEKCTTSADNKLSHFKFVGPNVHELKYLYSPMTDRVMLETSNPKLKFELIFNMKRGAYRQDEVEVEGSIRYESERIASEILYQNDPSVLRNIKELEINFIPSDGCWEIVITRRNHASYKYASLQSVLEVQEKFDEIMDYFDCIERFTVRLDESEASRLDTSYDRKIQWTRRAKKLLVRVLHVYGDHSTTSIHNLLKQIKPSCLVNLKVKSKETENTIFEMPHLYAASHIIFDGCSLSPKQLWNLNTDVIYNIESNAENSDCKYLTSAAINKHIKKCVLNLKERCCLFRFCHPNPAVTVEGITQGLPIIAIQRDASETTILVGSVEDNYVLEIYFSRQVIYGHRSGRESTSLF